MDSKKHPKLMFISEDGFKAELYIDGVKITGAKAIRINADHNYPVEHEVTYVTAHCEGKVPKEELVNDRS